MGVLLNLVVVVEVVLPQLPQRVILREEVQYMARERVE
jgi:hypothetical protein